MEDYDDYKNSMQFDARTIKITDLHLNLKMDEVKTLFAKYGNITNCVVQTPKDSLWQNAYVTYESPNAITNFFHAWGRLVFNDYVRVYPCSLTKEQVALRNEHRIKLTNLPFNTSARDLTDIIKAVDAKSCYIPRSSTYKPKPFAILFFENGSKLNEALKQNFSFGGNNLYWVTADTKVCHKCGSPNHLAVKCTKIPNKDNNANDAKKTPNPNRINSIQKLYHKYKPAGHKKTSTKPNGPNTLSYAEVAKPPKTNEKGKAKATAETAEPSSSLKASIHAPKPQSNEPSLELLNKKLDLVLNKLGEMQKVVDNLASRIGQLEKWQAEFQQANSTNLQNKNPSQQDTTPNQPKSHTANKRTRVVASSSESDNSSTPTHVTQKAPTANQIIQEQQNVINTQQAQLNRMMQEIKSLAQK